MANVIEEENEGVKGMGRHGCSPQSRSRACLGEKVMKMNSAMDEQSGGRRRRRGRSQVDLAFLVRVEDVREEDGLGDPLGQGGDG